MNDKELKQIINHYQRAPLAILERIKVQWACGEFSKHHSRDIDGYDVYWTDTKELVEQVAFGNMDRGEINYKKLFGNGPTSDQRIALTLHHWENGQYMDLPELGGINFGKLTIGDGRHRTIAAYHLGEKQMPIAIPKELTKDVQILIHLRKQAL